MRSHLRSLHWEIFFFPHNKKYKKNRKKNRQKKIYLGKYVLCHTVINDPFKCRLKSFFVVVVFGRLVFFAILIFKMLKKKSCVEPITKKNNNKKRNIQKHREKFSRIFLFPFFLWLVIIYDLPYHRRLHYHTENKEKKIFVFISFVFKSFVFVF